MCYAAGARKAARGVALITSLVPYPPVVSTIR